MSTNQRNAVIIAVIIIIAIFLVIRAKQGGETSPISTSTPATATSTDSLGMISTSTLESLFPGSKVEIVPITDTNPKSESNTKKAALLALGNTRKNSGDYQGAASAWLELTRLDTSGYVAFNNLANLYGYYLHDNVKAELYYLQAIKVSPKQYQASVFRSLYEFYRYVLKSDEKAKLTLRAAIEANPQNSTDFQYILDHYEN